MKENIKVVFNNATKKQIKEGSTWYKNAYLFCNKLAKHHKIAVDKVIQLCAVFSPQAKWEVNKQILEEFLLNKRSKFLSRFQIKRATEILNNQYHLLDVSKGQKVNSFYNSIKNKGLGQDVCLDTHAINLATNKINTVAEKSKIWSSKRYKIFQESYCEVANELGVSPQQLQAITWVAWRENLKK